MENEAPPGAPKSEETSVSQLTCIDSVRRNFSTRDGSRPSITSSSDWSLRPHWPGNSQQQLGSNCWRSAEARRWLAAAGASHSLFRYDKIDKTFTLLKSPKLTFRCSRANSEPDDYNSLVYVQRRSFHQAAMRTVMISTCRMSDPLTYGPGWVLLIFMDLSIEGGPVPELAARGVVMKVLHSSSGIQGRTPEDMDAHQRHVHLETMCVDS